MDTKKIYDANAEKWLRLEPSSMSDFTARPYVFDACGNLKGKSVLDLGCGEGYCARELMRQGAAQCVGIDLSEGMIAAAKQQEMKDNYGIQYIASSVLDYTPTMKFDLSIAVFLFNYLSQDAMQQVLSMVYSALNPGGSFVFSVPHPFFPFLRPQHEAPFYFDSTGKNYFTDVDQKFEGQIWKRNGEPLHVQCVHKTLSSYFESMQKAGFQTMPEVTELTVTEELVALDEPFFLPLLNEPLHLLFKVSK